MNKADQNKMKDAPLKSLVITMSIPTVCTMMVASLYNIVDSVYIAKMSQDALTALSLAMPVQTIVAAVASGISTGVCALASRELGAGNPGRADELASQGVTISVLLGILFLILGLVLPEGYLKLFTQDSAILFPGVRYLKTCLIFSVSVMMETLLEKILQASGSMIWPMCFSLVGLGLNLLLDPLMIFGLLGFPEWGILGAALATGISQTVAFVFAAIMIAAGKSQVRPAIAHLRVQTADLREITAIALPIMIQQSMSAFTTGLMDRILIGFGAAAVNVYNVFFRIQNLFMKPVLGIHASILPILSFNYGAGNRKRIKETLQFATTLGVGVLAVGMIPFLVWPTGLLSIFAADAEMFMIGIPAFRIICLYFPLAGATIVLSTVFAALSKSIYSMYIALIRQALVLLPAAWLLSRISLNSTWWCYLIAEAAALLLCMVLYRRLNQTTIKTMNSGGIESSQRSSA